MALPGWPLVAAIILSLGAPASGAVPQRMTWDELSVLVGKHVSIPMYGGGAVAGRVRQVEPHAILIEVQRSTNPHLYPKGDLRISRDRLFTIDVYRKGLRHRLMGPACRGVGAGKIATVRIVR
jgi:hypothetical protein